MNKKIALGFLTAAAVSMFTASPALAATNSSGSPSTSSSTSSQTLYVSPGVSVTITRVKNPSANSATILPADQSLPFYFNDTTPTNNVPWSSAHFTANSTTYCNISAQSVTNGITSGSYTVTLFQDFTFSAQEVASSQLTFGPGYSYQITWNGLTAGAGYNIQIASGSPTTYIEASGSIS